MMVDARHLVRIVVSLSKPLLYLLDHALESLKSLVEAFVSILGAISCLSKLLCWSLTLAHDWVQVRLDIIYQ